jgi:hypothetical protein
MAVRGQAGRAALAASLSTLALLGAAGSAEAGVVTVANTNDAGPGSLREAIAITNGNGTPDTIQFARGLRGTITLTTGQLEITSELQLLGPGANLLTVSGNHASRVFKIDAGAKTTISGLTVADGLVTGGGNGVNASATGGNAGSGGDGDTTGDAGGDGGDGGPESVTGLSGQAGLGGGIENLGTLTLNEVTVNGNRVSAGNGGNATAAAGAGGNGGTGGAGPTGGNGGAGGRGGNATATGGAGGAGQGGGIYNGGILTIQNATVSGNSALGGNGGNATANGGPGGAGGTGGANAGGGSGGTAGSGGIAAATGGAGGAGQGGGIHNGGTLTIQNATVTGNSVTPGKAGTRTLLGGSGGTGGGSGGSGGGGGGSGGNGGNATATAGQGGKADGGGIFTAPATAQATFMSVTLATNGAPVGANLENGSTATVQNAIVADPQGGGENCQGALASHGYNIDTGTSCGLGLPTDRPGTDPQLTPLQDNGGPTKTRAITSTSPAVDHGVSSGLSRDQRGVRRPSDQPGIANAAGGDGSDIGSFEILDATLPKISRVSVRPRTWAVAARGRSEKPAIAKRVRRGTRFAYSLSEPARVVFTIERRLPGRKVGRKCKKPTRSKRSKKRCTRYKRFGRFAQQGRAGKNAKKFSGKVGKKKLKPGTYRVTLVATDPTGNRSVPKRLTFTVVRRKRR